MVPPKEKKNRKNNPNHDANGKNPSRSKKKSKSNMHEKQEEDKNRTFEDLDSSPAWSQEISEAKGIDEAEDVVETPEDPVEVSRTAEQTNNVVAAEQVNAELLQEELSGSKRVANETELPPTTSEHEPDSGDVSSDTNAKNQASINPWSSDGGEVVDIADSKGNLGDGHQESSFQAQVSQKAVEVTKGDNVREDVVVSVEDTVPCAELKDEAASGRHRGSVPSTQPEPHQQPSPVPSKQLLAGLETATEGQISESQASIDQEPKHYDQPASPLQGVQEEQTTRPAPADLQLGSAPVTTSRDENTQTPKPVTRDQTTQTPKPSTREQGTQKPKPSTRNQGTQTSKPSTRDRGTQTPMVTTRDQGTQTPTVTTRDQGTQTEEVWIGSPAEGPKLQGRPAPSPRDVLKMPSNTPPSSAGPQIQENKEPGRKPEPQLRGTPKSPKSPNKDLSENSAQPAQEGLIRDLVREVPARTQEYVTRHAEPGGIPAPQHVQPVPSPSLRADSRAQPATTGRILKLVVNSNPYPVVANYEHILATNTTYFSTNACELTNTPAGRQLGRHVNFSGSQFSLKVIQEYSQWLSDGIIRPVASLVRYTTENCNAALEFLASCYVFGEHIKDERWMNDVMDAFIHVHIHDWRLDIGDVILYTYKFTKQTSPMRRLLVDMYTYCLEFGDVLNKIMDLPTAFLVDIRTAWNGVGTVTDRDWRERLNNRRAYHV